MQTALLCNQDREERNLIAQVLEENDVQVVETDSSEQVLAYVEQLEPEIVVLDIIMASGNGISLLKQLQRMPGSPCIVLKSSCQLKGHLRKALRLGADAVLPKPVTAEQVRQLAHLTERRSLYRRFPSDRQLQH
ncbi:response regulator [Alkalicoccus luteus]|uniref:Response regulator n=1 Tax=Alkalicoccus luteus TaxID=1237094 RepID=A0A969PNS5_9BACI|nr:response regulator [Alkalicoccus luteus]NJP36673.1 response regulator [Alkalicoccus luteus]